MMRGDKGSKDESAYYGDMVEMNVQNYNSPSYRNSAHSSANTDEIVERWQDRWSPHAPHHSETFVVPPSPAWSPSRMDSPNRRSDQGANSYWQSHGTTPVDSRSVTPTPTLPVGMISHDQLPSPSPRYLGSDSRPSSYIGVVSLPCVDFHHVLGPILTESFCRCYSTRVRSVWPRSFPMDRLPCFLRTGSSVAPLLVCMSETMSISGRAGSGTSFALSPS